MSPPRFSYRKLTAAEFKEELRQQNISIGAFARIFGLPLDKAKRYANGKEVISNWIPVALTLLKLHGALGAAKLIASEMIEDDRLHPELGKFPFRTKRVLPDDFETAGDN